MSAMVFLQQDEPAMCALRHVLIASRRSDLAWALQHEVAKLEHWRLVGIIDPRVADSFDYFCLTVDIVLIEADDLIWLLKHRPEQTVGTLEKVYAVVILSAGQILDVLPSVRSNCGLLFCESAAELPVDFLELAIKGYVIVTPDLLDTMMTNRLRLDIVRRLSRQELTTLAFLGVAFSNRRIAEAAGLGESRVKTLVHMVTRKLRMNNRTEVAVFAAANGLALPRSGGTPASLRQ